MENFGFKRRDSEESQSSESATEYFSGSLGNGNAGGGAGAEAGDGGAGFLSPGQNSNGSVSSLKIR